MALDDLIRDREVDSAQSDRLTHSHIADQLYDVVLSVPTPATIAVSGPWGSGKSGVANLLKGVARQAEGRADRPLRRLQVCREPTTQELHHRGRHCFGDQRRKVPRGVVRRTGRREAPVSAQRRRSTSESVRPDLRSCIAFFGAAMALFAWPHGGAFRPTFASTAAGALKADIAPAALLTSLMVLASRTLTREDMTDAADSDEQFEGILADLGGFVWIIGRTRGRCLRCGVRPGRSWLSSRSGWRCLATA